MTSAVDSITSVFIINSIFQEDKFNSNDPFHISHHPLHKKWIYNFIYRWFSHKVDNCDCLAEDQEHFNLFDETACNSYDSFLNVME